MKFTERQKSSPYFQEYKKQYDRINRYVKSKEKEGYSFTINPIVPPQTITQASVNKLKRMNADYLLQCSAIEYEGSKITGLSYKQIQRKEKFGKKAREVRTIEQDYNVPHAKALVFYNTLEAIKKVSSDNTAVLDELQNKIVNWQPEEQWSDYFVDTKRADRNVLLSILKGAIDRDGVDAVAARLEARGYDIIKTVEAILYSSGGREGRGGVQKDINTVAEIINGGALSLEISAKITDIMEEENFETTYIHPHYKPDTEDD